MPNTASATITGKTGPGDQLTSIVLANVTRWEVNPNGIIRIFYGNNQILDIESTITTFTTSISGTTWTLTLS